MNINKWIYCNACGERTIMLSGVCQDCQKKGGGEHQQTMPEKALSIQSDRPPGQCARVRRLQLSPNGEHA